MTVKWEILFKKRETSFPFPCFLWLECILDGWRWSSHQEPQGRNYVAAGQQQNKNEFRFFTPWSNLICFDCVPPDVISMGGKQILPLWATVIYSIQHYVRESSPNWWYNVRAHSKNSIYGTCSQAWTCAVQQSFLWWWNCSVSLLSNPGATGHMWLTSTWNAF